ncbi:MAG: acyl-CoA thioesterase [bacterium]|nr:acyl-CoA thioesterase [bacterium]
MIKEKTTLDSRTEHTQIIMSSHINGSGRLFGGQLLEWIDVVAGVVGRRHSGYNVVTVAIDNLQFKAGAHKNDIVVVIGKITYVGTSSMEVRVDTYVEDNEGKRRPINRAYVVMVALDENEHPVKVPRLVLESESERAEWEGGLKRAQLRKQRKNEGF